mgnify:CR=1 FL=1
MTAEEFKKYAGRKTFDKNNVDLTDGVVVGYEMTTNSDCLVVRLKNGPWFKTTYDIRFTDKNEEELYKSGKGLYAWGEIKNVILDEPKELDLTKILQGCEGVTLWSDIAGEVELYKIIENSDFPIKVKNLFGCESFSSKGTYLDLYPEAKCLLYPSETNRDWSTFTKPVTVKDGDWVACLDTNKVACVCKYGEIRMDWKYILPFEKFKPGLSDEELKKLSIV